MPVELWILDAPDNPLMLRARVGDKRIQTVRIDVPESERLRAVEAALAARRTVEIWGLYFDTASAVIQTESLPVIGDLAELMRRHPDWKLAVEGHTDNVGTPAANLTLSKERAGAVSAALEGRLTGAASRLTTRGYGASRPVESNSTLEGRARNRRVELRRL